jgi:hypothetical protein
MLNTIREARDVLISGGDLVALAEAIGTIISDPASSLDDLRLGLRHGGMVAEQALLELRRRGATPNGPTQGPSMLMPRDEVRDKPSAEAR